jgi:hypothetical protein
MAINKLKRGIKLWTLRGKTRRDSEIVRPVDVNKVIDEANTELSSLQSQVTANNPTDSQILYTETLLTSTELRTDPFVNPTVLPAPGTDKYYEIDKVIVEYKYGTETYVDNGGPVSFGFFQNPLGVGAGVGFIQFKGDMFLGSTVDKVFIASSSQAHFNSDSGSGLQSYAEFTHLNQPLLFAQLGNSGIDEFQGDGTLLIKVWYKVKTLGTEL